MDKFFDRSVNASQIVEEQEPGKKTYAKPRLVKFGSLASITGSSSACSGGDMTNAAWGMINMMTGLCS